MPLQIFSPAFADGESIPALYTADGDDISPPLVWEDAPADTKSLALVVDDPDAPDPAAPKRTWVHWVVYNLPADGTGLAEGVGGANLPPGALEGTNDWGRIGYGGPAPPVGEHRYFFKLFALDVVLPDLEHPTKAALEKALEGHVLAKAELIGLYRKQG